MLAEDENQTTLASEMQLICGSHLYEMVYATLFTVSKLDQPSIFHPCYQCGGRTCRKTEQIHHISARKAVFCAVLLIERQNIGKGMLCKFQRTNNILEVLFWLRKSCFWCIKILFLLGKSCFPNFNAVIQVKKRYDEIGSI